MRKPKFKISLYALVPFRWKPFFTKNELLWKDKFDSPRCEREPSFKFEWLWFGIYGIWEDDEYWEQWLWIHKYNGGDYQKAKDTWGWIDFNTKQSTWKEFN